MSRSIESLPKVTGSVTTPSLGNDLLTVLKDSENEKKILWFASIMQYDGRLKKNKMKNKNTAMTKKVSQNFIP